MAVPYLVRGEISEEVFWSFCNSWQKEHMYEQDYTFGTETYESKKKKQKSKERKKNEQILAPYPVFRVLTALKMHVTTWKM